MIGSIATGLMAAYVFLAFPAPCCFKIQLIIFISLVSAALMAVHRLAVDPLMHCSFEEYIKQ